MLLVVTNPVEATVTWFAQRTGRARERIIGLGTTVETARLSRLLADDLAVDARSVWAEVVGEHGPTIALADEDAVRRRIHVLRDLADIDAALGKVKTAAEGIRQISEDEGDRRADRLLQRLRDSHGETLSTEAEGWLRDELSRQLAPPATRFAIAAAVVEVVDSILHDRSRVLTVSGHTDLDGLGDAAVAAPFVVGRSGIVTCAASALPVYEEVAEEVRRQVAAMNEAVTR